MAQISRGPRSLGLGQQSNSMVDMEKEQIFYYVVRIGDDVAVWEMTARQMARRIDADPTLARRLDNHPFITLDEAVQCQKELKKST